MDIPETLQKTFWKKSFAKFSFWSFLEKVCVKIKIRKFHSKLLQEVTLKIFTRVGLFLNLIFKIGSYLNNFDFGRAVSMENKCLFLFRSPSLAYIWAAHKWIFTFESSAWPLKSSLNLVTYLLHITIYRKIQQSCCILQTSCLYRRYSSFLSLRFWG